MKYFAILLFGLLVDGSFGGDCRGDQGVNVNLIPESCSGAVKYLPVPNIEYCDNATKFKERYAKVGTDYSQSLVLSLYDRAQEIGTELINGVRKGSFRLRRCIESMEKRSGEPNCVNSDLKQLSKLFREFLELIPGRVFIKRQGLPDLPAPPAGIVSRTKKRPAGDVFVNLAKTLDHDFGAIYNNSITIVLAEWNCARTQFNILQEQFRNKILNGPVLKSYREAADEALQFRYKIQGNVDRETLKSFEEARDRIIAISEDYIASKNDEDCS